MTGSLIHNRGPLKFTIIAVDGGLVPACVLGGIGLLHIPDDIISAPATNICIGMAIDSLSTSGI